MNLIKMKLENFRCYKDEVVIELDDLVMFIGRNDIGKSTILDALNIFFEEQSIDEQDVCKFSELGKVTITCEFSDFSDSIVIDADNPTSLKKELLVNKDGNLEIQKQWDFSGLKKKLLVFAVANHPSSENLSDLIYLKIRDLKTRAKMLGVNLERVDQTKSADIRAAIRKSVTSFDLEETKIPLDKDPGKKIWSKLKQSLPVYALFRADRTSKDSDPEAQDPMMAALREAFRAAENDFAPLLTKIKERVQGIAKVTVEKMGEIDAAFKENLEAVFSDPKWNQLVKVSLQGENGIPLNKRGSGVRRLVLLSFFRAQAEAAAAVEGEDNVSIIYAIEEPETSQHPVNQKILLEAFQELSESVGKQVFFTSHNPAIARRVPYTKIRYIYDFEHRRVVQKLNTELRADVIHDLGVLPDTDVKLFIGVEGVNDINFLKKIGRILRLQDSNLPDLDSLDKKGEIVFIPCGGSNLDLWVGRLNELNVPQFHLFDGDKESNKKAVRSINSMENCCGFCTKKMEMENYLHRDAILQAQPLIDGAFLPEIENDMDVPQVVSKAIFYSQKGKQEGITWESLDDRKRYKKESKVKKWLNTKAVQEMTVEMIAQRDPDEEVLGWFRRIRSMLN